MNSDQGAQFTSDDYIDLHKEQQIQISMNGKGQANDNVITERFIRTLSRSACITLRSRTESNSGESSTNISTIQLAPVAPELGLQNTDGRKGSILLLPGFVS